jgi:hypothetical protein
MLVDSLVSDSVMKLELNNFNGKFLITNTFYEKYNKKQMLELVIKYFLEEYKKEEEVNIKNIKVL